MQVEQTMVHIIHYYTTQKAPYNREPEGSSEKILCMHGADICYLIMHHFTTHY